MTSISSYGQYQRLQSETMRLQRQQMDLQIQSTSGKKGTAIGDLGVEATHSLNMRVVTGQLKTYKENISQVELYASAMDTAMTRMGELLNDLRGEYAKMSNDLSAHGPTGTPNTTYLNDLGKRGLEEMQSLLNTQVEGRYIFAANDIHTAPVPDVARLISAFSAEMTLNLPVATPTEDIINNMKAYVGQPHMPVPGQAYFPGSTGLYSESLSSAGGPLKARVDVDRDIHYGLRADSPVFQDMMRAFATAATITYSPDNPDGYKALLKDGADTTAASVVNLSNEVGRLGITRRQISDLDKKHDTVTTSLKLAIGDVEDVDMAEVAIKLQQSNTALEATYRIIASMKNLSLVNFLS